MRCLGTYQVEKVHLRDGMKFGAIDVRTADDLQAQSSRDQCLYQAERVMPVLAARQQSDADFQS